MGVIINIIFFGIAFITLVISGGFATNSSVRITGITGYKGNDKLKAGHDKLTIAAIITWITVAVLIILGILSVVFGADEVPGIMNWVVYGFLILTLAAVGAVGVLSAIGAADIGAAKVTNDNGSQRAAIIAAVLAIVGFVAIIVVLLIRIFSGSSDKDKSSGFGSFDASSLLTEAEEGA